MRIDWTYLLVFAEPAALANEWHADPLGLMAFTPITPCGVPPWLPDVLMALGNKPAQQKDLLGEIRPL